ncbi:hypothetical protein GTW52_12335 [Streptomyces sp. SID8358]|uniref:DUF6461 domain-containing protein n=1 Tax=Streptomyces sp. SID8358 TaxID=2690342 RepID=UPI000DAEC452|nr:DUF6461 domain-containing protein [Streptomyces sp. SID8358]MYU33892.1 hypothetical protein [Streptomyces sp. SID8358]
MNPSTAADYSWIRSSSSLFAYVLDSGYTLTPVGGVPPAELFRLAVAEPLGTCEGLAELIGRHGVFTDECDD